MTKLWKKISAAALAAALMLSCMAGCSGGGTESKKEEGGSAADESMSQGSSDGSAESSQSGDYAEHMTLSVAVWGIGDTIIDGEDEVRDRLYDKFNIDIEPYAVTWGDYGEKIQLWAATNQLPDITAYDAAYTDTFRKWRDQGVVRALPDNWASFENVAKMLDNAEGRAMNEVAETEANPVFYGIPRPNYQSDEDGITDYGIAIRRDWMENVGVTKVPETPDELLDLLKKFVTDDPNQSSKADTVGLAGYTFSWMTVLMNGECPDAVNGFRWSFAEDGSLVPCFMTKNFLNGVKVMKEFYDAGVIDPDYIIYKGEDGRDKFLNGQAGAYAHSGPTYSGTGIMAERFGEAYPDKSLDEIVAFVPLFANSETGKTTFPAPSKYWSETYLSSNVDDAKAQRCMALMDYLLSVEGYEDISLGIEGVSYKKLGEGKYEVLPMTKEDGSPMTVAERYPCTGLYSLGFWGPYRQDIAPGHTDGQIKLYDDYQTLMFDEKKAAVADAPNTKGLLLDETKDLATADDHYEEIINQLMTSDDIDAAWQDMVDSYMSQGYDQVIAEMNQLYKDAGR